jgi:hypothetical protein
VKVLFKISVDISLSVLTELCITQIFVNGRLLFQIFLTFCSYMLVEKWHTYSEFFTSQRSSNVAGSSEGVPENILRIFNFSY